MLTVGFDIGGTFTDLVLFDGDRERMFVCKIPTTPGQPEIGVLSGLSQLFDEARIDPVRIDAIFHATTIATNAILERKGCRTGLLTTRGFRDVLLIGRQKRYDTQDLYLDKPEPLVQRRSIREVDERVAFDGTIVRELDMKSVDEAIDQLLAQNIESVAVALLHSYANSTHEEAIKERIAARAPHVSVSLSSDVSAKSREYERTNTTVANAYVKPIVSRYLSELSGLLSERGIRSSLYIMQSNGGVVSPELASEYPVRIVESGPAAGVLMCSTVAKDEGFDHVLTFDMGGTTAKLGAVDGGKPAISPTFEVDAKNFRKHSGLPLNVPSIELLEIGAGGGSIASVDMGLIKVGPQSAGAEPGPICYRRGGTKPTVTDANLVLGYLNPDYFNGGNMALDPRDAAEGIERCIAKALGVSLADAAWGIHAVANSNMETAMRVISVERGRDPSNYVLVAFGGAGPLHAARLARSLGIPKVIVPKAAGVGSAVGLLAADTRIDVSLTRILPIMTGCHEAMAAVYSSLETKAREELGHLPGLANLSWRRYAYMRYKGQGFEVQVNLPSGPIDKKFTSKILNAFHVAYERNFGYRDDDALVEGVDWQLVAIIPTEGTQTSPTSAQLSTRSSGDGAVVGKRSAYFVEAGGYIHCKVVDRYRMEPGMRIPGPAIVEERESTSIVLPGDVVSLSERGNLVISIAEDVG